MEIISLTKQIYLPLQFPIPDFLHFCADNMCQGGVQIRAKPSRKKDKESLHLSLLHGIKNRQIFSFFLFFLPLFFFNYQHLF